MTPECPITLRSPTDLIAVTPYVLGFHPADSIVVIGVLGRQIAFGARYDLPPPEGDDTTRIAAAVARQEAEIVTVIGYGNPTQVTPAVLRLLHALRLVGVRVHDALRVTDGRWWSYLCGDPGCCPIEGRPCPADSAVAAAATYQGQVALPDRQALVAQVAAVQGAARTAMAEATERARARRTDLLADGADAARSGRSWRRAGWAAVRDAERCARSDRPLTDDQVAWLGMLLADTDVHDDALDRCDGERWRIRLWTDVLRRVQPGYVPAPACLLGYAAWRAGHGALARIAVDRALVEDPAHRVARLLDRVLCAGIGPNAFPAPRSPTAGTPVPADQFRP